MKILLILSLLMLPQVEPAADSVAIKDTAKVTLTLEDILKVAMSKNVAVKVADREIVRTEYARKGTYAALYPQIDASAGYQRTIQKQQMFFDQKGMEFGYFNNWSVGVTAKMPVVNASLWESLKISADQVELAVEKARSSRLDMVTEVKTAYFEVLLAKESLRVYEEVLANARKTLEITELKFIAQKISELQYLRAKTTVDNAIPDVYRSRYMVDLALWQLKAVMGVDLNFNMDVAGTLEDYAKQMFFELHENDNYDISDNSSLRQLENQIEQMSKTVKMQQYAYIPSLALAFSYTYTGMGDNFNFNEYRWTPNSYVGLTIAIPIFSGGKRYSDVKQSKVKYDELQMQKVDMERKLKIAVKSDIQAMETGMKNYYAAVSAVQSAQKGYEIAQLSYNVGRSTIVELNDALLALTEAELQQWQSVYAFLVAKADLEKQLGKDYEENE